MTNSTREKVAEIVCKYIGDRSVDQVRAINSWLRSYQDRPEWTRLENLLRDLKIHPEIINEVHHELVEARANDVIKNGEWLWCDTTEVRPHMTRTAPPPVLKRKPLITVRWWLAAIWTVIVVAISVGLAMVGDPSSGRLFFGSFVFLLVGSLVIAMLVGNYALGQAPEDYDPRLSRKKQRIQVSLIAAATMLFLAIVLGGFRLPNMRQDLLALYRIAQNGGPITVPESAPPIRARRTIPPQPQVRVDHVDKPAPAMTTLQTQLEKNRQELLELKKELEQKSNIQRRKPTQNATTARPVKIIRLANLTEAEKEALRSKGVIVESR